MRASPNFPTNIPALHRLLRRAFQLSRSLPDELLQEFQRQTAAMPRATEAERLVVQRVGQDIYRKGLVDYWEGRCAVTGLDLTEVLRASHIKPWSVATDFERLDVFNGILLAPQLDALFDKGFLTFLEDGQAQISAAVSPAARVVLGIGEGLRLLRIDARHRPYLAWHRTNLFKLVAPDARG